MSWVASNLTHRQITGLGIRDGNFRYRSVVAWVGGAHEHTFNDASQWCSMYLLYRGDVDRPEVPESLDCRGCD